jgi:uncharacterized membrane protein YhaH (DUF805 family)
MQTGGENPYATPVSDVRNAGSGEYGTVKLLSVSGRLGRLRYIAFSIALLLITWLGGSLLMGIIAAIMTAVSKDAAMITIWVMMAVIYGALFIGSFMLAIQRLHDFDSSGWLTLLFLVPLVNVIFGFILWFVPGTDGENRFGRKTPPNGAGVKIMVVLVPFIFIFIIGILAAIAIPQYNEYVKRAQEARQAQ